MLPVADESIDLILCREAAHHVEDLALLVAELARVLKAGTGILILVEPFRPQFDVLKLSKRHDCVKDFGITHQDHWLSDYLSVLKLCGFEVKEMKVRRFRPGSRRIAVRTYREAERLLRASGYTGGFWFKRLSSIVLDGAATIVARRLPTQTVVHEEKEQRYRAVRVIPVDRLRNANDDIERARAELGPFLEVLGRSI